MRLFLIIVIAYLLGSIPFGYLIVRAKQGADIRETGSGGTGATNVSRRAGKVAGVITLILDALKGAAAILIAKVLLGIPFWSQGGYAGPTLQLGASALDAYWWLTAATVASIAG